MRHVIAALLVVTALALAIGVAVERWDSRIVLGAVAAIGAAATVFDIAEVSHQRDESNTGLARLAVAIAVGHALIAVLAVLLIARPALSKTSQCDGSGES